VEEGGEAVAAEEETACAGTFGVADADARGERGELTHWSDVPSTLRVFPVRQAEPSRHLFQPAEEAGEAVSVEGEVAGVGAFGVADADAGREGGKFHAFTGSAGNRSAALSPEGGGGHRRFSIRAWIRS
jgi:hypothetical protein